MPLARQVVPVALKGLDQASPRDHSAPGELDEVLNMVAKKGIAGQSYEFFPRPGVAALSKTADAGSISTGHRLGTLGQGLVLLTNDALFRKASDSWHRVSATVPRISVQSQSVYAGTLYVDSVDACYVNGYTVSIYLAKRASVTAQIRYTVRDATGTAVVADALIDTIDLATTDVQQMKAVAIGTRAILTYRKGALSGSARTIVALGFDSAAPGAALATANVTTTANAGPYDVQATPGGSVAVAWVNNTTTQLTAALVNPATMAVSGTTAYASLTALTQVAFLTNSFSSATLYVAHYVSGSGIRVSTFDATTLALGTTTVFDGAATDVVNVAGYRTGATVSVYYSISGAHIYDYQIKVTTGSGSSVVMRSIHLGSRVLSANGTLYALGYYRGASDGTGSYFLIDLVAAVIVGKALQGLAPMCTDVLETPMLMTTTDANTWLVPARRNVAASTTAGTLTAYVGCSTITFEYADPTIGRPVELNSVLHIPGSMPYYYDGQSVVEHGFPVFPEPSDTPVKSTGGEMTPSSTYAYLWVYEWTDAAGNLCRSAPAITTQYVEMGASDTRVEFSLPTNRLTRKTNVSIAGYRAGPLEEGDDGSVFHKVTSSDAPLLNDPTVDRVTFIDELSDEAAEAGEPLYINGDVLENIAPPPCKTFAVHKGRLLCGGVDGDPSAIWFSKDVVGGFGVSFNDGLVSRLSSTSEPVTALTTMDSYAVAATATTVWVSGDEYPDDLGNGGVLKFVQRSSTVGAASAALISRSDRGVLIWSGRKGPWFFSEGLDFKYAGAAIQDDADTMSPAALVLVPGQNQTRIVGSHGSALATAHVLESVYATWAKWAYDDPAAAFVDAVVWGGDVAYLTADGTVYVEDEDTYFDAGAVEHAITLAELSFAGVKGFQRVYAFQPSGRILGSGTITLSAIQTYDGVELAAKERGFTNANETDLDFEVDPGTYGKCSKAKVKITDSATGSAGTAWTMSGCSFLVGVKAGINKVPPSRRAT